ncbi:MAG: chloride channel protein [Lachnospiraceae bacterium]|nr:chloride channel protein [Lachnospiraceae bacterium]
MGKRIRFLFFAVCIGGVIGAFIWGFLRIMGIGQELLFTVLPKQVPIPCFVLVVCILGGVVIGVYEKLFHASPDNMEVVMATIKKEGKYPCDHLATRTIAALLPLIFGACLGPEAGLTGIIAGLCFWAGSKFRYAGKHMEELANIGLGASLGVIFRSPLFGYSYSIEETDTSAEFSKTVKMVTYITAILGGFGAFMLLGWLFGGGDGLPRLPTCDIGNRERFSVILLIPAGIAAGMIYTFFHAANSRFFHALKEKCGVIVCTVLGGICLGIFGLFVPFSMFSGETQMEVLAETYMEYTPILLIGIGIGKIFLTNVCIQSGWKGGHFFPVIFAGVSIGYGMGIFCSVEPVFAATVATSALLGYMMKKPVAVVLLSMLCFPIDAAVWSLLAAAAGAGVSAVLQREK